MYREKESLMVHSQLSRYHQASGQDVKERSTQNRSHRNQSPSYEPGNYRRSPRHHSSPVRTLMEAKGDNRSDYRRGDTRGNAASVGNREFSGGATNKKGKKPRKWRRNRKKLRANKSRPVLSGGNSFPVSNRQLVATMRMRMDDYAKRPRLGRMLPMGKNSDIDRAVARARREASTRTKDTFWTKKLLDAESSHPNRWAHSGFKELYREELGYTELEKDKRGTLSPLRGSKDESDAKRSRSSPSNKQRSSREALSSSQNAMNFLPKGRNSSRKVSNKRSHSGSRSRSRSFSKSRSRSGSRSPRGRRRHIRSSKSGRSGGGGVDSGSRRRRGGRSRHRPGDRVFSRSLSRSPTSSTNSSTTSSSTSRSRSRSYSSYSRSSSSRSSSSSSSFSSSSTGSVRSPYRKRSYSRATKSWSRSPSAAPRPPPPKIKATSLSKAVQSVHSAKDKKFSKPVAAGAGPLPPDRVIAKTTSVKMKPKAKPKPPRTGTEPPIHSLHGSSVLSPPGNSSAAPEPAVSAGEFYNKEVINPNDKAPPFVEAVDKASFKKMDVRRGPETQYYKGATQLSREVNTNQPTSPHSDGGSNSDSSTDEEEGPMKMTLSERFGKLAQLSSQRQEYDGVRMKIVREGGQDKKVYLERDSRSSTPRGRRSTRAHERWLREHKEEYDEYEERYGEFRHWDPHRDLPRELPPNWEDVNVRYRYYKESGYFGERSITMEDYLKWEEWWYRYRDWLEKYGGAQEEPRKYRGPYTYEAARVPTRDRWIRREKDERKRHHY